MAKTYPRDLYDAVQKDIAKMTTAAINPNYDYNSWSPTVVNVEEPMMMDESYRRYSDKELISMGWNYRPLPMTSRGVVYNSNTGEEILVNSGRGDDIGAEINAYLYRKGWSEQKQVKKSDDEQTWEEFLEEWGIL